jgi:3-hydroxyphenylacetate 6-hydroxylase
MAIATVLSALQGRVIQSPWQSLGIATLILPFLYVVINEFVRSSARVKGMQGPTGLPLIGNLAQIRTNAAEQYRIWSRKFGPVYQIQLGNIPVVVVNSAAAAKVLFGHNAQALSSRPEFYTFHKVSRESSCPSTLVSCMRLA